MVKFNKNKRDAEIVNVWAETSGGKFQHVAIIGTVGTLERDGLLTNINGDAGAFLIVTPNGTSGGEFATLEDAKTYARANF